MVECKNEIREKRRRGKGCEESTRRFVFIRRGRNGELTENLIYYSLPISGASQVVVFRFSNQRIRCDSNRILRKYIFQVEKREKTNTIPI